MDVNEETIKITLDHIDEDPQDNVKTLNRQQNQNDGNKINNDLLNKDSLNPEENNYCDREKVNVFTEDKLPQWHNVQSPVVTPPIVSKNLVKAFKGLPIYGKPKFKAHLESFETKKLREFIGSALNDVEFDELADICSSYNVKTDNEIFLKLKLPTQGISPLKEIPILESNINFDILKKCKLLSTRDLSIKYISRLKYRCVRLIPPPQDDACLPSESQLEPGKDLLFHLRLYRPFVYNGQKERNIRGRHAVFSCTMMLHGRQYLSALRDRIVCHNDLDIRVDVSDTPDTLPNLTSKEVFPSGFLFINNVFYVDTRKGCSDHSAVLRAWAAKRGIGEFTKQDMCKVRLDEIVVKLGYPDVYVHQGNCEHMFAFSEIRLVTPRDPLWLSQYPYLPSVSQNQTIYCTTCAEFGAKWIVAGCRAVPFDPAYFCDTCFRQYLYKDGQKIGQFKAYSYKGNEINMLKPQG